MRWEENCCGSAGAWVILGLMSDGLAIVRDYKELIAAIRARRDALDITHETIDAVAGLQAGYTSKLLVDPPMKCAGRVSLGAMLGALGLMLLVVEDPAALERVRARLTKRKYRRP